MLCYSCTESLDEATTVTSHCVRFQREAQVRLCRKCFRNVARHTTSLACQWKKKQALQWR